MKEKKSILDLPDEQIGKAIRVLYEEHEDFVMATFGQSTELPLTPREVVRKLRELGMDQYASQIYILAAGLMIPVMDTGGFIFKNIDEWRAAYQLSDELGVPVDTISPSAALKYLREKSKQ